MKKGILTVVSGFAGSGKGTIMNRLLATREGYALSISATTRRPREGEQDGEAYFFKSVDEFETMIRQGNFLEYASYVGNYYGTPAAYVDQKLAEGYHVILEIEVQGALKVKEKRPDTLLVFVSPPSAKILEERLRGRGTEQEDVILARMRRSAEEATFMEQYDYILINDKVDDAVEQLDEIIRAEHCRAERMRPFISSMKDGLKG